MKKYISLYFYIALSFMATACATRSVLPKADDVKMSRDTPPKNCVELGPVTGRLRTEKGNDEQVLADLRQEAAYKGANYVRVRQYSSYGTAVTGVAYECP